MSRKTKKQVMDYDGPEVGESALDLAQSGQYKYLQVNIMGRRIRDLNRGERSTVDLPDPHTTEELVRAEIAADELKIVHKAPSQVLVSLVQNE